jgi:large subunit ribosomal protein L3
MKTILAFKVKMTQVFDKDGNVVPVTLVKPKKEDGLSVFGEGDKIAVWGITKGKGFQGVVKRHGFHGGPRTHGQKHSEREPGSIGQAGKQRVFKGMRMAGRMGGKRMTIKNLKVIKIDAEKKEMMISGAVPGRRGTLLEIYES